MITAVVQFELTAGTSLEGAGEIFKSTAPRYLGMAGSIRKNYLFDPETGIGGGCYLLESQAAADAIFNHDWRSLIKEKYGAEPDVHIFETPFVVDNLSHEIVDGSSVAAKCSGSSPPTAGRRGA